MCIPLQVSDLDGSAYGLSTRAVLGCASEIHAELQAALEAADAVRPETS